MFNESVFPPLSANSKTIINEAHMRLDQAEENIAEWNAEIKEAEESRKRVQEQKRRRALPGFYLAHHYRFVEFRNPFLLLKK